MKYMLLAYAGAATPDGPAVIECTVEEWQVFHKEIHASGVVVSSDALADLVTATTVRVDADGRRVITDGPFAESREVLGGFYVIDVPDLDTALDWAARCPGSRGSGAMVVRPVANFDV